MNPPVDHDGPDAVAVVGDDLERREVLSELPLMRTLGR